MTPLRATPLIGTDAKDAARLAARALIEAGRSAFATRGTFSVALAGGSTPRLLHETLVTEFAGALPWRDVEWFFGDERCVPPDHADSNYGMAKATLFDPLTIPESRIHRLGGEAADADAEAHRAEADLRATVADGVLDLVILGLGPDGHIASLFPGTPALGITDRLYASNPPGMNPRVNRITLTFPALRRARAIHVCATGAAKAAIVRRVLVDRDPTLPATSVASATGDPLFILDAAAATELRLTGR